MIALPEGEINLKTEFAKHYEFTEEHFEGDSYMWGSPQVNEVTISNVSARNPGKGRFSFAVKKLLADGFRVIVPTPSNHMRDILEGWGFKGYRDSNDGCELWIFPHYPEKESR